MQPVHAYEKHFLVPSHHLGPIKNVNFFKKAVCLEIYEKMETLEKGSHDNNGIQFQKNESEKCGECLKNDN